MGLLNTLVNGHAYDFTSIKLMPMLPGAPLLERFVALNYEQSLEVGELRGRGSKVLGTTRGEYSANASMTIYAEDFSILQTALMTLPTALPGPYGLPGFMERRFMINVTYAEAPPSLPITDVLRGCRITRVGKAYSRGNEPLMVDIDLHVMEILLNNVPAVIDGTGVLTP